MKIRFNQITLFILALSILFFLGGCAGDIASNLVKLPTGDIVSAATDRFGSWERVEIARSSERKSENELMLEKVKKSGPAPQIVINDKESMVAYKDAKAYEALAAANKSLADIATALAVGNSAASNIPVTPFPQGAFAEGFRAFGAGAKDVLSTPASGILAGGYAIGKVMQSYDAGHKIDSGGGDIVLKTSNAKMGNNNTDSVMSDIGGEGNNNADIAAQDPGDE